MNPNATAVVEGRVIQEGPVEEQTCGESETYDLARFIFVLSGSGIAFLGVLANVFLLFVFGITSKHNVPPTLYPRVLAILDLTICAVYVLIFGADAAIVLWRSEYLFALFYIYVIPVFVVSRIAQLAIPYVLIFATLERLAWTVGKKQMRPIFQRMFDMNGLYLTVTIIMIICTGLRLPTAWVLTVKHYPGCPDFFRTKSTLQAEWAMESVAYHVFDFHLLSIAQTVVPFFLLLLLNFIIVKKVSRMSFQPQKEGGCDNNENECLTKGVAEEQPSGRSSLTPPEDKHQPLQNRHSIVSNVARKASSFTGLMSAPRVKSAIYTMVSIVASYLICNTLHLILTVLERSDSDLLKDPNDPGLASTFHTRFSDIVSFVYMFTSAMRLLIHYFCNSTIRSDINGYFCKSSSNEVPEEAEL